MYIIQLWINFLLNKHYIMCSTHKLWTLDRSQRSGRPVIMIIMCVATETWWLNCLVQVIHYNFRLIVAGELAVIASLQHFIAIDFPPVPRLRRAASATFWQVLTLARPALCNWCQYRRHKSACQHCYWCDLINYSTSCLGADMSSIF